MSVCTVTSIILTSNNGGDHTYYLSRSVHVHARLYYHSNIHCVSAVKTMNSKE